METPVTTDASQNVIKAGSSASVNSVFGGAQNRAMPAAAAQEVAGADDPAKHLNDRILELEANITEHDALVKKAFNDGFAKGREAAQEDFEDNRDRALEALNAGLADANAALKEALGTFEDHALSLAAEAMGKLAGDPDAFRQILSSAIRHQLAKLGEAAVLSVIVSRSDFPDSRELSQVNSGLSVFENRISVSDELPQGCCKIDLFVGTAEIDINRTWTQIRQILRERETGQDDVPL